MDLTRLYNLTTPELRDEAERLGVTDTYAMSRGQLIHAIRNKAGSPQPEGLLGKVFGFARWALQAAGETSSGAPSTPKREPMPVAAPRSERRSSASFRVHYITPLSGPSSDGCTRLETDCVTS